MNMRQIGLAAAMVMGVGMGSAQAALSIASSVGGVPTGATLWNLDGAAPSGIAAVNIVTDAGFVTGSGSGYAAPYLSGNNGTGFGSPDQPNGVDTTRYLTTGSTGAHAGAQVEIVFTSLQQYLGLLWGSVDTYNTLEFFNGATSVGTITGGQVTPTATGDQGANGTYYVNINSSLSFDRVVFSSSSYAFEFDNLAWASAPIGNPVPEPATMALFGAGLLGLGALRRRRKA